MCYFALSLLDTVTLIKIFTTFLSFKMLIMMATDKKYYTKTFLNKDKLSAVMH